MNPPLVVPTSRTRRQDSSIQALRGVAVILLVAFHVIGSSHRGLGVADGSPWHVGSLALEDIRMPLFTLISGYVYAMVPVEGWRDCLSLLKGKSRRVLLPLLTVSAIYYILGQVVPGTNFDERNEPLWRVFFYGFEHLWFLQAIFIIFIAVGLMDAGGILGTRGRWLTVVALSAIARIVVEVSPAADVFSIGGAIDLFPFFLLGYGLRRHGVLDLRGRAAAAAFCVFCAIYTLRLMTLFGHFHPGYYVEGSLALAVGAMGIVLMYSARHVINVRILAWIGGFSYGIYLLHVLATSATRMALVRIGIHQTWELFVAGLFMGVAAPIAFQLLFRNVGFVRTFVLGERGFTLTMPERLRGRRAARTVDHPSVVCSDGYLKSATDRGHPIGSTEGSSR
jgi:acyltransferase